VSQCQTGKTVFHRDIKTPRRELKIRRGVFSTKFEVFGYPNKQCLKCLKLVKREKNVKIYANLDCEQSLSFPRVVRVARSEGRARAVSGEAARSAGAEEKEKECLSPFPPRFFP